MGKYGPGDVPSAHHACASKKCVVDRVGLDVTVVAYELDLDDDQVVDVVQVFADALFRVSSLIDAPDDQVTGRATVDLADGMSS